MLEVKGRRAMPLSSLSRTPSRASWPTHRSTRQSGILRKRWNVLRFSNHLILLAVLQAVTSEFSSVRQLSFGTTWFYLQTKHNLQVSPLWNSSSSDLKGRDLVYTFANPSLKVCNIPKERLSYAPTNSTFVDVTVAGDGIRNRIRGWRYLSDPSLSHHFYTYFTIDFSLRCGVYETKYTSYYKPWQLCVHAFPDWQASDPTPSQFSVRKWWNGDPPNGFFVFLSRS